MTVRFRPFADRILVEPIERVKSEALHVVMDEKPNQGTVVAVGPGKKDAFGGDFMPLRVGDRVRFGTMGKDEYLTYPTYFEDGKRYLVLSWQDVAFVEED